MVEHPTATGSSRVSRRRLLQLSAAGIGLLALAACGGAAQPAASSTTASPASAGAGSTAASPAASTAASATGSAGAPAASSAGGSAASSSGASRPASAAASGSAAPAVKADPAAILKYGQARVTSLDPIKVGIPLVEQTVLFSIFDPLISYAADGTFLPRLATDWKIMPDRVRLTLRQNVTFQDGTPFNADAVKFSLERAINDPASTIKTTVPMLDHVDVVDPMTADLVLKTPQPQPLLEQLTSRAGMIVSPAAVKAAGSSDAFSQAPVGAGMYKISGPWLPREKVSVRAWPGYWDKPSALLAGVDFSELPLNEIVNDIRAGAVDFLAEFQGTDMPALKQEAKLKVYVGPIASHLGLDMNLTLDPFTNAQVRQAIAFAIDRDSMVKALTGGIGKPAYQPFWPNSPAYDSSLDGRWQFDVAKAKATLAAAGFPNGVTFKSIIGANTGIYINFSNLLQAQLKNAGITMDLQLVAQADTVPMFWRQGPDGHGIAASSPLGGIGTGPIGTDTSFRNAFLKDGTTNAGNVEVPGVRDLVDKAAAASDRASAATLYKQASKIISDGLYSIIPMYYSAGVGAYWEYVGGVKTGFVDTDPEFLRGVYITPGKTAVS